MKKRLRKKLQLGEFKVYHFEFDADLAEMDDDAADKFLDRFVELVQKCGICCHGEFGDGKIELCMETGIGTDDNAGIRQAFLDGLKDFPEIVKFTATELA